MQEQSGEEACVELWTIRIPETGTVEAQSERAEAAGWDGIAFTDSQNLIGDPFVAMALGAKVTNRLRFATAVTNVATRHPAALATVAATVQEESGGRVVLGVGRGDTALFHLGRRPQPIAGFFERVNELHTYLGGGTVDCAGFPSRLRWLERAKQPRVPVDIAASGPKVIAFAATTVERVTFAIGADAERMAWGLAHARDAMRESGRENDVSFGAYVTVGCHPDRAVAREMIRGAVAAFAHFSAMPGSTGAGLADRDRAIVAEVGDRYDSNLHLVNTAPHTAGLDADFVDRFAIVGDPQECVRRLCDLAALGLERFVITGVSFGADPTQARLADRLVREEVLPALRAELN
jgi:5,10-methylenetetrahydromethanopterin reductase